jgi:hypothetical protein
MPQSSRFRAVVAAALTFAGVALYFLGALILRHMHPFAWVGSAATLAVPAFAAIAAYRYVRRDRSVDARPGRSSRWQRYGLSIGGAAYALTAAVGVPAVQNDLTAWAVARCDRLYSEPEMSRPAGVPLVEVHVAVPVLPGLILAYTSYAWGPMTGQEAWGLYGWYGVGTKLLAEGVTGVA